MPDIRVSRASNLSIAAVPLSRVSFCRHPSPVFLSRTFPPVIRFRSSRAQFISCSRSSFAAVISFRPLSLSFFLLETSSGFPYGSIDANSRLAASSGCCGNCRLITGCKGEGWQEEIAEGELRVSGLHFGSGLIFEIGMAARFVCFRNGELFKEEERYCGF